MNDEIIEPKRACGTCQFSVKQLAKGPNGETIIGQEHLVCQRRPPQIVMISQNTPLGETNALMTHFPPVTPDMYCFDYWPLDEAQPDPTLFDLISGEVIHD